MKNPKLIFVLCLFIQVNLCGQCPSTFFLDGQDVEGTIEVCQGQTYTMTGPNDVNSFFYLYQGSTFIEAYIFQVGDLPTDITIPNSNGTSYNTELNIQGAPNCNNGTLNANRPSNDFPTTAEPIDCNLSSITGTTSCATNVDEPAACGQPISSGGVWYTFSGTDAMTTLDLCNTSFDSKMSIYLDDGNFTCITGEDDDLVNCGGDDPSISFLSSVGQDYLIYIYNGAGGGGDFTLNISCECTTTVLNSDDSGYGSLRQVLDCAMFNTSTITFAEATDGVPIQLTSALVSSGQGFTLKGNGQNNTIIDGILGGQRLLEITSASDIALENLTLTNGGSDTYAGQGACINKIGSGHLSLLNCTISNGETTGSGGGIAITDGNLDMVNCTISDNQVGVTGSAIYIEGTTTLVRVEQCLIHDNIAQNSTISNLSTLELVQSTLADNSSGPFGAFLVNFGTVTIKNNIHQGNIFLLNSNIATSDHNLSNNPGQLPIGLYNNQLGNASFLDPLLDDYQLENTSIAISAGNIANIPIDRLDTDLDGNDTEILEVDFYGQNRVYGCGLVDLGVYEHNDFDLTLMVTNANDSGPGSLRHAIDCAPYGYPVIIFSEDLNGIPIQLQSPITTGKGISLNGNGPNNTIIDGSLFDGSLFQTLDLEIIIDNLTLQNGGGSETLNGGALELYSEAEIRNCQFINNQSQSKGGAIYFSNFQIIIENSIFNNNQALEGSAIFIESGGIFTLANCLLYKNNLSSTVESKINCLFVNNTFIEDGNSAGSINLTGGPSQVAEIHNNIFQGSVPALVSSINQLFTSNNLMEVAGELPTNIDGNIITDPLFVDSAMDDYHLTACSPAINRGEDSEVFSNNDYDGDPRILNFGVDIGWDEYNGPACPEGQCNDPIALEFGITYQDDNYDGANNLDMYNCIAFDESGPEKIYEFMIPTIGNITATLVSDILDQELNLFLMLAVCDDNNSCFQFGEDGLTANNLFPGTTYYIVIDGKEGAVLDYELTLNFTPLLCVENDISLLDPYSPSGVYHAISSITTNAKIDNTSVVLKAEDSIQLDPGFELLQGNEFEVLIEGCP